jgi:RNA polymerase sigma factor (TIGR02999 family)
LEPRIETLIGAADGGDAGASQALFAALYAELHRLAKRQLARAAPGAGLGATSLLHEAYLDIAAREGLSFPDRARFLGYASRVMRGLIIDAARARRAQKRGGKFEITALDGDAVDREARVDDAELVRLSAALDELATAEPELAQVVDLKFFCGFSLTEIAALRGLSERTLLRQWQKARLYLHRWLREEPA